MKKGAAVQNKLGARVILRKIYSTTAYDRATRAVSLRPTKTRHPPSRKSDIGSGTGALWLSCNTSGLPLVPIYQISKLPETFDVGVQVDGMSDVGAAELITGVVVFPPANITTPSSWSMVYVTPDTKVYVPVNSITVL